MKATTSDETTHRSVAGRHLILTLPSEPGSAGVARRAIAELIGDDTSGERRDAVLLAVSEAVTNAVLHAYADVSGTIDVFALVVADQLILTVSDLGRGTSVPARHPGLGMGLRLIRDAADDALVNDREGGGTSVQCLFSLRAAAQPRRSAA